MTFNGVHGVISRKTELFMHQNCMMHLLHKIEREDKKTKMQVRITLQTLLEVDVGSFLTIPGTADTATPPV
jgi:hypothetical protein